MSLHAISFGAAEPAAAAQSGLTTSPIEFIEGIASQLLAVGLAIVMALPSAAGELARVIGRSIDSIPTALWQASLVAAAMVLAFGAVRRATAAARRRAGTDPILIRGLSKQVGLDLLAVVAAAVVGRVLLVRWLHILPGTEVFQAESSVALMRWLIAMTVARFFFQPDSPQVRLVRLDDAGARKALRWTGLLLAVGHAHSVLLAAALRHGLSLNSERAISMLVALGMAAGAIYLFRVLRRHGIGLCAFVLALLCVVVMTLLWLWGLAKLDFNPFRGALGTITVIIVGLTLDRVVALSIQRSRRPRTMRALFIARVMIDSIAVVLIAHLLLNFWFANWFAKAEWSAFSQRFAIASAVLAAGIWLSAALHVWVEAQITPPEGETLAAEREALRARLSSVLPIVRLAGVAVILAVAALVALSFLGVDITPLMAGAGILGLAISLGSQTLVKDIVSGLFYMFDDVFRIGEVIETGTRRGKVERISARSLQLRDPDGRLHTIPFSELGTITNSSRRLMRLLIEISLTGQTGLPSKKLGPVLAQALRSERSIQGAIVGSIAVDAGSANRAGVSTLILSFVMGAGAADSAEPQIRRLVETEILEAGYATGSSRISIGAARIEDPSATGAATKDAAAFSAQAVAENAT